VTLVREGLLRIGDDDFRAIIACTAMNGVTNFLVSGSHLSAAEQQRRCVLARANELLKQLMATIRSLEGADLEFVIVPLQELFDWVARERERETVPLPPPNPGPINVARY
jgi:hypothetical protein